MDGFLHGALSAMVTAYAMLGERFAKLRTRVVDIWKRPTTRTAIPTAAGIPRIDRS
jgi:hypothetical protein